MMYLVQGYMPGGPSIYYSGVWLSRVDDHGINTIEPSL
jgi:hypothetical protein